MYISRVSYWFMGQTSCCGGVRCQSHGGKGLSTNAATTLILSRSTSASENVNDELNAVDTLS